MKRPLVIVTEPASADRLRAALDARTLGQVDFLSPKVLLAGYDDDSLAGEARRRTLETLYAALRNRIVLRLAVLNLNPEAEASGEGLQPADICSEWAGIRRTMGELLNESAWDGARQISVLVAAEGDWRVRHRTHLELLGGLPPAGASEDAPSVRGPPQRCYLVTRSLELGQDRVLHARDIWPLLVAGLVDFLCRATRVDPRLRLLDPPGVYAWRTVHFVPEVNAASLATANRDALAATARRLFNAAPEPLFGDPLPKVADTTPAELAVPDAVQSAMVKAFGTEWTRIHDGDLPRGVLESSPWATAVAGYAAGIRNGLESRFVADDPQGGWTRRSEIASELSALAGRIRAADDIPGKLLTTAGESSPDLGIAADPVAAVELRRLGRDEAADALAGACTEHMSAARAFVSLDGRFWIALVVAIPLVLASILAVQAAQPLLPVGAVEWQDALWTSLCGIGGLLAMLGLGFFLQNRAGRRSQQALKDLAQGYLRAEQELAAEKARAIDKAWQAAALTRRHLARRLLARRVARVGLVLREEFQASTNPVAAPLVGDAASRLGKAGIVRYPVVVETLAGLDLDVTGREQEESFLQVWRSLLGRDTRRIGFVPLGPLLHLAEQFSDRLLETLRRELSRIAVLRMASGDDMATRALERAIGLAELEDPRLRFFSVDLAQRGLAQQRVWHAPGTEGFFRFVDQRGGLLKSLDPEESDLVALWHGEVELAFVEVAGNDRIQFRPGDAAG